MASQFENRLVGISILVAIVVIFLPTIIDGKKMAYEDEFVATPIHPEIKEHTQHLNTEDTTDTSSAQSNDGGNGHVIAESDDQWQVEEVATVTSTDKKEQSSSNDITSSKEKAKASTLVKKEPIKVVKQTPQQPKSTKKTAPESAWTIQLGAFQNASNINSLLKTLHKAGFQAHTVPAEVVDGKLTRLFVGPDVSKSKLEKQLPRLKRLTKLEGKLYPFDAVNP